MSSPLKETTVIGAPYSMVKNPTIPVNMGTLARESGYGRTFIQAARNFGYKTTHGARTTVESFLSWVAANPAFRSRDGFQRDKLRRPDLSAKFRAARRAKANTAPRSSLMIMNGRQETDSRKVALANGNRRFKHPHDKHARRNITLHPEVLRRADVLMRKRAISDLSGYLAALINEDHDRRVSYGSHDSEQEWL